MQFYLLNLSGENKNVVNIIEIILQSSKDTKLPIPWNYHVTELSSSFWIYILDVKKQAVH
jgi:hypothetical protein